MNANIAKETFSKYPLRNKHWDIIISQFGHVVCSAEISELAPTPRQCTACGAPVVYNSENINCTSPKCGAQMRRHIPKDPWNREMPKMQEIKSIDGEIMEWIGHTTVAGYSVRLAILND